MRKWQRVGTAACAALVLAGCAPASGGTAGQYMDTAIDGRSIVLDLADEAKDGRYAASEEERAALAQMTLQLENEYLSLYTGTYTDVAVLDRETGKIWFSNPAVYGLCEQVPLSAEAERSAYSTLIIDYYDNTYKATMGTLGVYPDAVSDDINQAKIACDGKTLTVTYTLGSRQEDMVYYGSMTKETYGALYTRLEAMAEADEISYSELGLFERCYEAPEYSGTDAYVLYATVTTLDIERLAGVYRQAGVTAEQVAAEEKKTGIVKKEMSNVWFVVPLTYRLSGRDLLAEVDTRGIQCADRFYLNKIHCLTAFGASPAGAQGYVMAPNGSGILIDNDSASGDAVALSMDFYGADYGRNLDTEDALTPGCTLPVFGINNGDTALFGIVESGDGAAGMTAYVSGATAAFNGAYPYFVYQPGDSASVGIQSTLDSMRVFSKTTVQTTFRVRYHFLYGAAADYSGMAAYYRTVLEQTGVLTRLKEAPSALTVELLGSLRRKKPVLGVPVWQDESLTTFAQAQDILGALRDGGAGDMAVLYSGVLNGGLNFRYMSSVKVQGNLGGAKDYNTLLQSLAQQGTRAYTGANLIAVARSGNGYNASKQNIRSFDKQLAAIAAYNPSSGRKVNSRMSWLVSPFYYEQLAGRFLKSFGGRVKAGGLYLQDVGAVLAGDYNENREILREQAKQYAAAAVRAVSDAGYSLTMDGGNAYVLPYADRLVNVALTGGNYRLQSREIPFVQMVLHGFIPYSGGALNLESDQQHALLKAVETGAGLYYKLMYADNTVLLDTAYTDLFSTNYAQWTEKIAQQWQELAPLYRAVAAQRIVRHAWLTDKVAATTYENGVTVTVNYGEQPYTADGGEVPAGGYLVQGLENG